MNLSVIWRSLLGGREIIHISELDVQESGMIIIKMSEEIVKNLGCRATRGEGLVFPCL